MISLCTSYQMKTSQNPFLSKKIKVKQLVLSRARGQWTQLSVFQHLAEHVDAPQLASSFEAAISKFDQNFSAHLLDLLARLSIYSTSDCEHGMASVISRWVGWPHLHPSHPLPLWSLSPPQGDAPTPPLLPAGSTSTASTPSAWSACLQRGARGRRPMCLCRGWPSLHSEPVGAPQEGLRSFGCTLLCVPSK